MPGTSATDVPVFRSLADQLRSWPAQRLAELIRDRPDLATPPPQDSSQLASRAATRTSILRALDLLTQAELRVLHGLVTSPETAPADDPALRRLEGLALAWRSPSGLRALSVVADLLVRSRPDEGDVRTTPPGLALSEHDPALMARTAAGAAFEAVRRTELLLDRWGSRPPGVLRTGGLAVKDLRAVAALLHVDERAAAFLVELAATAGLLAVGPVPEVEEGWLPTDAYDAWSRLPVAERWAGLVRAWLASPRVPSAVGSRDATGKALNALAPGLVDPHQVDTRRLTLAQLAELPPGSGLATGTGVPSLVARVAWLRPRRPPANGTLVAAAVEEAALLGVIALGGLVPAGHALLAGDDALAAKELAPLLPVPLDHILIQGDLTAIAPGPLEHELAQKLQDLADVESRGGATVYRFAASSVRGALDVGWSAAEIHEFLARVSRTPVPQPLTYLVDDTARSYGSLRIGYAEAVLRSDDEAALEGLLRDSRARGLGLRRVAPTVLVSTTPIDLLLQRLRELGAAPVVEAADGTVHVARPDLHRARNVRSRPPGRDRAREEAQLAAAVAAVQAGDRAAAARASTVVASSPAGALAFLREAIESRTPVWIGYVDNHGATSERIVEPRSLEGGVLTGYDHRTDDTRTFAVHRITAVRTVEEPDPPGP